LVSADLSPRCKVWTEPECIDKVAHEFAETEDFLKAAEELGGPYEWGRFDMLVLPTSFPYGGMENPCLTFVTPALIAGDRSLVDVVAHEIAHSWTGNLVTNFDWPSFWLNEGFTMVMERKITGMVYGGKAMQLSALLGQEELLRTVKDLGEGDAFTALEADLANRNPDDAFSSIPYEKAFNFLHYIETQVGGPEAFDPYLKAHIQHFSGKSIASADWKAFLYSWFEEHGGKETIAKLDAIDWKGWLYGTGVGPNVNEFDKTLAEEVDLLAAKWTGKEVGGWEAKKGDVEGLSASQKMRFLDNLIAGEEKLPVEVLERMDAHCWYQLAHSS
jgi:leukotriene-A4 hydrolase